MTLPCTPGFHENSMHVGKAFEMKTKLGFEDEAVKRFTRPRSAYAKSIGASVAIHCKNVVIIS